MTHFSESRDFAPNEATAMEVGSNINIMDATKLPEEKAEKKKINTSDFNYSPKNVSKLLEDAQNVEQLLKDRQADQDALLDAN